MCFPRKLFSVRTDNPREVGSDRIVDVAAAYYTYHRSCIVVDLGTATTYDYVSKDGVFEHTVISPGIQISAHALTSQTAKLPEIEIAKPASILGKNTIHGMQAGVVYGYIGQVEYIIRQMKKELHDEDCLVIATGGLGKIIANETSSIDIYEPDLAGKGISIIYQKNKAGVGNVIIPKKWGRGTPENPRKLKFRAVKTSVGAYMTIVKDGGEFKRVILSIPMDKNNSIWGMVDSRKNLEGADKDTLEDLEF